MRQQHVYNETVDAVGGFGEAIWQVRLVSIEEQVDDRCGKRKDPKENVISEREHGDDGVVAIKECLDDNGLTTQIDRRREAMGISRKPGFKRR